MTYFTSETIKQLNQLEFNADTALRLSQNFLFKPPCKVVFNSYLCNCYLGSFSYINPNTICTNTYIGNYCSLARYCEIGMLRQDLTKSTTSPIFIDSHKMDFAGYNPITLHLPRPQKNTRNAVVNIGHDVWIGAKVKICEDVSIGNGAVIGTGALITKDVPPYAIVVDQDRILRFRFKDEIISDLLECEWWQYNLPLMANKGLKIPCHDPLKMLSWLKNIDKNKLIYLPKKAYYFFAKESQTPISQLTISRISDAQVTAFFKTLQKQ